MEQAAASEGKTQNHLEATGVTWKTQAPVDSQGHLGRGWSSYLSGMDAGPSVFSFNGAGRAGSLKELRYSGQTSRRPSQVSNLRIHDSRSRVTGLEPLPYGGVNCVSASQSVSRLKLAANLIR